MVTRVVLLVCPALYFAVVLFLFIKHLISELTEWLCRTCVRCWDSN